jgi:hypothetical protein
VSSEEFPQFDSVFSLPVASVADATTAPRKRERVR